MADFDGTNSKRTAVKVLLFANTGWYLYNFRLSLAEELRCAGYEVVLASPPDQYGLKLRDKGFKWIEVPMLRRSVNPIREAALLYWLIKLLQREEIQLIHSFTLKCAIYGSLAARLAGVPARISAVAGLGYAFTSNGPKATSLRLIAKAMLRIALGGPGLQLVLQNPDDEIAFRNLKIVAPEKIQMIPGSGVNCNRFKPAAHRTTQKGNMKVLLPARMLRDKGVREFIEAARKIESSGGGVDFIMAGAPDPGNPTSILERELLAWESEGVVTWLGHVDDMAELFQSVDVVALPSYREGLPKGLIEAAACGKPLIAADVPGCNLVVRDHVNGLLVPVRDSTALAQAILLLRDQPDLRASLGQRARAIAKAEFDERLVLRRTCALYSALLPNPSKITDASIFRQAQ